MEYLASMKDEMFEDIKQNAIKIWNSYDDTHGYASGKIKRVNEIKNYKDNWITLIGMFDAFNKFRLYKKLKKETLEFLTKNFK